MWVATDLVEALPDELEVVVAEQRHRPTVHDGVTLHVDDSTLLARRRA
jgi:hypothetical protein